MSERSGTLAVVASWGEIARDEPDFAARVQQLFDARKHKTMATLRSDGSPRISGIELTFDGGELRFGSMPDALKGRDLRRDSRLAVHSPSVEPPEDDPSTWAGEAKIAGRAVLESPAGEGADSFRVDIGEVVLTRVGSPADHLVIESWHSGRGLQRRTRA